MEENNSNMSTRSPESSISSHSNEMTVQENDDYDMKTSPMSVEDFDLSFSDANEAIPEMTQEEDVSGLPKKGGKKPVMSYIGIIAMAIMSSPKKKMLLSEIYQWISEKFLYFKQKDRSWRNSIRHNLSLNECFVKSGRSENGKGNYWTIHPANLEDFSKGDFHRRRARRRVRKSEDMQRHQAKYLTTTSLPGECMHATPNGYVPMSSTVLPTLVLTQMFGAENILTREEQLSQYFSAVNPIGSRTVNQMTSPVVSQVSPVPDVGTVNTTALFSDQKSSLSVANPHSYQLLSPPLAACRENGWQDFLVPL